MPHEERLDEHGERRRVAERLEAAHSTRDLERPEDDRAEQRGVAAGAGGIASRMPAEPRRAGCASRCGEPAEPPAAAARSPRGGAAGRSARARSRAAIADQDHRDDRRHDGQRERRLAGEDPEPQAEAADDQRGRVREVGEDQERDRLVGDHARWRMPARRSAHACSTSPPAPPAAKIRDAASPAIVIW